MGKLIVLLIFLIGFASESSCQSVPISTAGADTSRALLQTIIKPISINKQKGITFTVDSNLTMKEKELERFNKVSAEVNSRNFIAELDTLYMSWFFSIGNEEDSRNFFGSPEKYGFLQNIVLSTSGKSGSSAYIELMNAFWGPFRAGFGAQISTGDSAVKKELNGFVKGGGNVSMNLCYPWLTFRDRNVRWLRIHSYLLPRIGMVVPGLDQSNSVLNFNTDLAAELHIILGEQDANMQGFLQLRGGAISGTLPFYSAIGAPNAKVIWLSQAFAGLTISSRVSISISAPVWCKGWIKDRMSPSLNVQLRP